MVIFHSYVSLPEGMEPENNHLQVQQIIFQSQLGGSNAIEVSQNPSLPWSAALGTSMVLGLVAGDADQIIASKNLGVIWVYIILNVSYSSMKIIQY